MLWYCFFTTHKIRILNLWIDFGNLIDSLDSPQTKCHRRTQFIHWPTNNANDRRNGICFRNNRKKRRWMGHVIRVNTDDITGIALNCTPQGKRKQRRPRETWRFTAQKQVNKAWLPLRDCQENCQRPAQVERFLWHKGNKNYNLYTSNKKTWVSVGMCFF